MIKLVADLHTHTVASGHAYSTVREVVKAAADKGLAMIAITDHGPAMPGGPHAYHFGNLHVLPENLYGVEILKGVEANIIDHDGTLDLPERYLKKLDLVLAGLHTRCYPGGTVEENTRAVINAMRNPYVDVLVHPGNPEFVLDYRAVVAAAIEYGVLLEVNNSSLTVSRKGSKENCKIVCDIVRELGAEIVIGSDAHFCTMVGEFSSALAMVEAAGIAPRQIVNTSLSRIKARLRREGN